MCAINPVSKKRFVIDVYTSDKTLDQCHFEASAMIALLDIELQLNTEHPRLRFHLKESTEQAD